MLREWAQTIAVSAPHEWATYLLRNVPGLPPIVQTIHILSVVAVVASIVFIHLRVLGLALPSQSLNEMMRRLLPWTWWALPVLLVSGLPFILARPQRYFLNPVFGIKVLSITLVLAITYVFVRALKKAGGDDVKLSLGLKLLSAISISLWLLIILAGRWIAYVDYLFPRT